MNVIRLDSVHVHIQYVWWKRPPWIYEGGGKTRIILGDHLVASLSDSELIADRTLHEVGHTHIGDCCILCRLQGNLFGKLNILLVLLVPFCWGDILTAGRGEMERVFLKCFFFD